MSPASPAACSFLPAHRRFTSTASTAMELQVLEPKSSRQEDTCGCWSSMSMLLKTRLPKLKQALSAKRHHVQACWSSMSILLMTSYDPSSSVSHSRPREIQRSQQTSLIMQDQAWNDPDSDSTGPHARGQFFTKGYDDHEPWEQDCRHPTRRHPLELEATKRHIQADMQRRVAAAVLEQYMQASDRGCRA